MPLISVALDPGTLITVDTDLTRGGGGFVGPEDDDANLRTALEHLLVLVVHRLSAYY